MNNNTNLPIIETNILNLVYDFVDEEIAINYLASAIRVLHKLALLDSNVHGEVKNISLESIISRAYNKRCYDNIQNNLEFSCFLTAALAIWHPFNDANKRTAALLLQYLVNNDLSNTIWINKKNNKFEYEDIIIDIVKHEKNYNDLVNFFKKLI